MERGSESRVDLRLVWPAVLLGIVATAIVALFMRDGWDDLQTSAGTVDKQTAAAFLATMDADWRTGVETETRAGRSGGTAPSLPPQARCYFVTSDDGKRSLGSVACGPVRRIGTAEGAVWDTTRIEAISGGNQTGQARLRMVEGALWQQSVPQPADGRLVRPDGEEPPEDADVVAAPPTPQAAPGLVLVLPELPAKVRPRSTDDPTASVTPGSAAVDHSVLIAPDVTVTLTELGAVDTVGTGGQVQVPASGERFLVARFTVTKTRDPVIGSASEPVRDVISGEPGRNVKTRFAVTINDRSRPVDLVTTDPSEPSEPSSPSATATPGGSPGGSGFVAGGYLVVSVATAASAEDVLLTATTQGVTQSLSLLTGHRTSTSTSSRADGYYRSTRFVGLNQRLPAKTVRIGRDFRSTYTVGVTTAGLTAWDPDRGWASPGQAWLRFGYSETWDQPSALYEITWNPGFFTATADGQPVRLPSDYNTYTKTLTAAVPANVKTVRITITARFTFLEKAGIRYAKPMSGTADFGTLTTNAGFE